MLKYKSITVSSSCAEIRHFAIVSLLVAGMYLLFSSQANATVIASVLCSIIFQVILLDVGRAIATLAVVALGISAMLGKASWGQGLILITGIGLVFGGPSLVFSLASSAVLGSAIGALIGGGGAATGAVSLATCSVGV